MNIIDLPADILRITVNHDHLVVIEILIFSGCHSRFHRIFSDERYWRGMARNELTENDNLLSQHSQRELIRDLHRIDVLNSLPSMFLKERQAVGASSYISDFVKHGYDKIVTPDYVAYIEGVTRCSFKNCLVEDAAIGGHVGILSEFLDDLEDDERDEMRWDALQSAVRYGQIEVVRALINDVWDDFGNYYGSEVEALDQSDKLTELLDEAAKVGQLDMITFLRNYARERGQKDTFHPRHTCRIAIQYDQLNILTAFIDQIQGLHKGILLRDICRYNRVQMIAILMEKFPLLCEELEYDMDRCNRPEIAAEIRRLRS